MFICLTETIGKSNRPTEGSDSGKKNPIVRISVIIEWVCNIVG